MDIKEQAYTRYEQLKEFCRLTWDEHALSRLDETFHFARTVIGRKQFKTGEFILNHSLEVATIIAEEIGLEPDSVVTGLLHNIMYAGLDRQVTREELEKSLVSRFILFSKEWPKLMHWVPIRWNLHPENYRKLLIALAGDARVILIKTADRLQVMRNLDIYD
jgi:GTP diphosphokinase / guanosine-3',5'-bis(diphosphate) 3'-diphosphatase